MRNSRVIFDPNDNDYIVVVLMNINLGGENNEGYESSFYLG